MIAPTAHRVVTVKEQQMTVQGISTKTRTALTEMAIRGEISLSGGAAQTRNPDYVAA